VTLVRRQLRRRAGPRGRIAWSGRVKEGRSCSSEAAEDRKRARAPSGPPISERRAAGGARQSTYVPGFLVLPDGSSAEIVISNISDAGAELRSPRFFHHNKPFTLAAPTLGLKRRARVVWNTGNTFGVAFVD
jgi:hypothetical protein